MSRAEELAKRLESPTAGPWDNHDAAAELRTLQARVAELEAQLAGQGEPLAYIASVCISDLKDPDLTWAAAWNRPQAADDVPVFTRPATPLTRQQVSDLVEGTRYSTATAQERADFINGIRWAEKAHGITKGTAS